MSEQINRQDAEKLWEAILEYGEYNDSLDKLEKAFADVTFWRPVAPKVERNWFAAWSSSWGFTRIFRWHENTFSKREEIKL